jgi:hypothetical protein
MRQTVGQSEGRETVRRGPGQDRLQNGDLQELPLVYCMQQNGDVKHADDVRYALVQWAGDSAARGRNAALDDAMPCGMVILQT